MIIILRIKNPLKWCLWLLLMKQSGINPEWSIWIIESLVFSHFTGLRFGAWFIWQWWAKGSFPFDTGCPAWTVDGTVSKGSKNSNPLDAQRNKSSNKSASSLHHRSPNTSPSLQVLWRLLWAAETTKVLLINWHKPPSLKSPPSLRGAWHSHCLARLTQRQGCHPWGRGGLQESPR